MATVARLLAVCVAALALVACASAKAAHVAAGVTSIRIRSAAGVTSVTRPATVRQIVSWFDALPHFVARPCPYATYQPPDVRFVFHDAYGGVAVRAVAHAPGTCAGSIASKRRLLADDGFVARVSGLVGVDFDPNARTKQNEAAAKLDEQRLLTRVRVPQGSERIAKSPAHQTWRVHLPLEEVFGWEQAHRPRGAREVGSGTGAKWGVITDRELMFTYPPFAGRISDRSLNFELIVKPHGWTRIDVRAHDTPIVARSPNEKVPAGVTQLVFRSHLVTDRTKVAEIVRWFDALPIVQPGARFSCPALVYGPVVRLDFRDAAGSVLARARMPMRFVAGGLLSTPCTAIRFSIGGTPQTPLVGGHFFVRVERLLGLKA